METNLVIEGLKFMMLGMGTVFAFLVILIFCMNAMSSIIHKFFPEPQANAEGTSGTSQQDNSKIIAAITAAIKYHREG
ncbi:MAG: OadG family protein [Sulfurimonas sp.]